MEKKASRSCDRTGSWEEGDYTNCHYTNDITRVLHTFILVRAGHMTHTDDAVTLSFHFLVKFV